VEISTCPECGRIFVDAGTGMCIECAREEERQYETVRKYLSENPSVSIDFLCSETGVKKEKILKFLRQGRLLQVNITGADLRCEVCGTIILSGRVCEKCVKKLQGIATELQPEEPPQRQTGKMHIFEHIKNK
jgi:uncharacterized OB-fold protein